MLNNLFTNKRDINQIIAITWYILSIFSSVSNDIIAKYMSTHIHITQIIFLRFIFSAISLIPIVMYCGSSCIKTNRLSMHIFRGVLLFFGIVAWIYGLKFVQVTTASVIGFSIPIFTLVLGFFILKENISVQRWLISITGFVGVVVAISPHLSVVNSYVIVLILSAIIFAGLDIINKKFVETETSMSMLFYSSVTTALLTLPFAIFFWKSLVLQDLLLLMILGISANLILWFILKAYAIADATAVAPYRYIELIISAVLCYLIFEDVPAPATWYGALIIIPSVFFIMHSETKRSSKEFKNTMLICSK
jgi:S-adenosylmethionine uptake transporter